MTIELGVLIGIICTIAGTAFGYFNWRRNDKKDIRADAASDGELRADINYIRRGVEDIRVDLKAQDKRFGELTERVTRVEESAKQAHKRIDRIEESKE